MDAITRKKPVLKLVHPGGVTERHKNPITAAEIMKKNPRHFVTRPDVFKFPWIVVRPESLLQPGDVFYIVPFRTVRGLMRRKAHQCQLLNQQSPDSCRSEDYESERARESLRTGSCPYDSPSERTKIVKRRSPNACQNTERCRLGECYAGNLTYSKKHCLDQLGEILQQQRQGHDSPSNKRNEASSRHRLCGQFLEDSCTYDSSNKVKKYTGGDYCPLMKGQTSNACPTMKSPKPRERDLGSFGCQSEGTPSKEHYLEKPRKTSDCFTFFCPQSEADGSAGDSEGWYQSSTEESRFHWPLKSRPPGNYRDVESPFCGDQLMGDERYFDILIDDRQRMQGLYGGAKRENLASAGRAQDDPYSLSDDKGNHIFWRDGPEMKLDQSEDGVLKFRSCLKKSKNKLCGRRVRFTLPGEDDDNLGVKVF